MLLCCRVLCMTVSSIFDVVNGPEGNSGQALKIFWTCHTLEVYVVFFVLWDKQRMTSDMMSSEGNIILYLVPQWQLFVNDKRTLSIRTNILFYKLLWLMIMFLNMDYKHQKQSCALLWCLLLHRPLTDNRFYLGEGIIDMLLWWMSLICCRVEQCELKHNSLPEGEWDHVTIKLKILWSHQKAIMSEFIWWSFAANTRWCFNFKVESDEMNQMVSCAYSH